MGMFVSIGFSASFAEPITQSLIFKTIGEAELEMKLYYPPDWKAAEEKLPALVLFFGGGWHGGDINHFHDMPNDLARRGMIVVTPEYRTGGKYGATPDQCLEDAKSAMRYVYANADALGVDVDKVAAGGRSAGGQLAASTAFSKGFNAEGDDESVRCVPDALVLFNPVIDNGPGGFGHGAVQKYWKNFSPMHNISTNPPPTIFLTGDKDQYTPIETAHKYKVEMEKHAGRCDLIIYEGGTHGSPFYGFYQETLQNVAGFLVSLEYLKPGGIR